MVLPRTRDLLETAIGAGAFPAAAVEVGRADGPIWQQAFGRLTRAADASACTLDTVFDLASLTKVMATTSLALRAVEDGRLSVDMPVADVLPGWGDANHRAIRLRHLLDHSSGLPAHATFWQEMRGEVAYARAIHRAPLERPPGTAAVYSDLGFIVAGFLLEQGQTSLDAAYAALDRDLGTGAVFNPPEAWRARIAPTEFDPSRGRLLVGEVHDENAAALGGVAGHAGLFGTAPGVGAFARVVLHTFRARTALGSPALMHRFAARTGVAGSSRALGWDTMTPTASCGTRLSPTAIGHTGFTGTSIWIDWERDLYVTLLTNRVHPTRHNPVMGSVRPALHNAVVDDLEG